MRSWTHPILAARTLPLALAALLWTVHVAFAGDPDPGCPGANRVTCDGITHDAHTPTFSTKCVTAIGFGSAGYDYPAGAIVMSGYTIGPLGVHLVDSFTFLSPLAGPVTFGLRVHYDVLISGNTNGHLFLLPFNDQPGDVPAQITFGAPGDPTTHYVGTLVMTLTRVSGAPVGLEIDANFAVGGLDSGAGSFSFDFVLPPGTSVTSCNGYVQDAPVPAAPASWGAVKAAYR